MNDSHSFARSWRGSGFWASGQIPGVRIHGPIRPVLDGSRGMRGSEQAAGADHPECFIQQFQIHRIDLQHPPPGVTHNQTGHVMQAGSEGAGPIAVPLETEGHAQENQQVAGNHIQVQTDRIGPECTAGQVRTAEIAAQFLETIFRAVCTLVVPPHNLRIAEPFPIRIRRNGTVDESVFQGAFPIHRVQLLFLHPDLRLPGLCRGVRVFRLDLAGHSGFLHHQAKGFRSLAHCMQGSGEKPGLGQGTILMHCRLPLRFRDLGNQVTDIPAHPGPNGETGSLFPSEIDDSRLAGSGICSKPGNPNAGWQGLDTVLEKLDMAGRWRYIALAEIDMQHLTGLCDMPHHRGKSPLALAGTICGFPFRVNHRRIDIQGHRITGAETRLQQSTIDLGQDIPGGPMLADRTQPVAQGTGAGNRRESRQLHQAPVLAQVHDVIKVSGAFMQHQHEDMKEGTVSIASIAARGRHPLIHDFPEFETLKQGCRDGQSGPGGDVSMAFCGFAG